MSARPDSGLPKTTMPTPQVQLQNDALALKQAHAQLAALQASSSWRITAPLRWAGQVAKVWFKKPVAHVAAPIAPVRDYEQWVRYFDSLNDEVITNLCTQVHGFAQLPLFSVLLPVDVVPLANLSKTVASVQQQIYPHWELCIALSATTSADVHAQVASWAVAERRIKFIQAADASSNLNNTALSLADDSSACMIKIFAADIVAVQAIFTLARALNEVEKCELLYADEDVLNASGERSEPFFKPDWNVAFHTSRNLVGRFGCYRTSRVRELGGYLVDGFGAADFDLSLRYLEQIQPAQIVHIPQMLFHAGQTEPLATAGGKAALAAHFERRGIAATIDEISHGYRVHYALPAALPQVSLIIPTRNGLSLLRQCIESIQEKTSYPNYDIIIVDNGSDDAATLDYFKLLSATPNVQVVRIDAPFNYSALNNAAVKLAKGELVGLLNNDIEVISPNWLNEMVSHALQPEVGAVGARLWFPDGTLQHGGVVLGIHGWAAHAHNHFPKGSLGYQGRMALVSEFSAVTGACLVVKKSSYLAVGGLNDDALKISCNDVDFCLKLQKLGLRNVWTPFADLVHHESATRGFEDTPVKKARFAGELAYMQKNWREVLANDPAYSPNLTLNAQDFSLAWPPRVPSLVRQLDLQPGQSPLYERLAMLRQGQVRVAYLAENVHSSTFRYRAANMAAVLNVPVAANEVQTSAACFFLGDLSQASDIVAGADILVISRVRHDFATAAFVQQFKAQGKKVWFDIDDWVFDPQAIGLIIHTSGQIASDEVLNYWHAVVSRMGQTLLLCDGAITTNHYLAQKITKFANVPVKVIPNFANEQQLVASQPLYEKKTGQANSSSDSMRLGYFSGSASHNRDIALLLPALEIVMAGDPRVKLVLVGPVELGEYAARFEQNYNHRIERHAFTDYVNLQQLIAGVDFNLVPLQANEFTHCKSELKYVDAANVGTLTIASPTHAYAAAIRHGDNGYLAQDNRWLEVLLAAIATKDADLQAHQRMTATAYQDVQNRFTYKTQREVVLLALEVSHDLG
jgi:O-antigen biosynthesis protein